MVNLYQSAHRPRTPLARRLYTLDRPGLAHQRKTFGVIDGLNRQVYVEIAPVEMMWIQEFDIAQLADRNFSKPGKVLKCHEPLTLAEQEPKFMLRDVRDLNDRNGLSTRSGFHYHDREEAALLALIGWASFLPLPGVLGIFT